MQTCSNCRFWVNSGAQNQNNKTIGQCRRLPAIKNEIGVSATEDRKYEQPTTVEDNWCGEYQLNVNA